MTKQQPPTQPTSKPQQPQQQPPTGEALLTLPWGELGEFGEGPR